MGITHDYINQLDQLDSILRTHFGSDLNTLIPLKEYNHYLHSLSPLGFLCVALRKVFDKQITESTDFLTEGQNIVTTIKRAIGNDKNLEKFLIPNSLVAMPNGQYALALFCQYSEVFGLEKWRIIEDEGTTRLKLLTPNLTPPQVQFIQLLTVDLLRNTIGDIVRGFTLEKTVGEHSNELALAWGKEFSHKIKHVEFSNHSGLILNEEISKLSLQKASLKLADLFALEKRRKILSDQTYTTADIIRQTMIYILPISDPTVENVASAMGLHERTLQRRLQAEGINFRELLNQVRHKTTLKLINDKIYSLKEITVLLGFKDQRSFYFALEHWTNKTWSEWRNEVINNHNVIHSVPASFN